MLMMQRFLRHRALKCKSCFYSLCGCLQVALTKRITNRARLEEVARSVIADATDKLLEVGLDEHRVSRQSSMSCPHTVHNRTLLMDDCDSVRAWQMWLIG